MIRKPLPECHGGIGDLDWIEVLNTNDLPNRALKFIHDDRLPPGASVGNHQHESDEEYYYILTGEGQMILDGQTYEVGAGDITAVFPGGSHALKNTGKTDMRFLVICVEATNPEKGI
jgi:uncharacterized cupin superfamily protein